MTQAICLFFSLILILISKGDVISGSVLSEKMTTSVEFVLPARSIAVAVITLSPSIILVISADQCTLSITGLIVVFRQVEQFTMTPASASTKPLIVK
ncbi:MAG: hypothetical protein C00003105_00799 [ANME-2 cluster archaeon HR1]|nr:MAG: hypothetical protein C00003105_00799 [ANME-2 cluster archaeon HR1]